MISIQVVYALPENTIEINMRLDENSKVSQAIMQSNILSTHNLDRDQLAVGIYGRLVGLSDELKDGDRIEIYRPLINDPKEIRRQRAVKTRNAK